MKTIQEAARELGRTPQTIRRWIRKGTLNALCLPNGTVRIYDKSIEEIKATERYSLEHAAKVLLLSTETLRRMIVNDELQAEKINNRWIVTDPRIRKAIKEDLRSSGE